MRRPRLSGRLSRRARSLLSRLRRFRILLPTRHQSLPVPPPSRATTPRSGWRSRPSSPPWTRAGRPTSSKRGRTRPSTCPYPRDRPPPLRAGARCRRPRPWRSPRSRPASWRRSTCRWRPWTTMPTGRRTPALSRRRCPPASRSRSALKVVPPPRLTSRRVSSHGGPQRVSAVRGPMSPPPAPMTTERALRQRRRRVRQCPRNPPLSRRKPSPRSPPCPHRLPGPPISPPSGAARLRPLSPPAAA